MKFTNYKWMKKLGRAVLAIVVAGVIFISGNSLFSGNGASVVYADRSGDDLYNAVSVAMMELEEYLKTIELEYSFTPDYAKRLQSIYSDGRNYIANNGKFESFDITSYVTTVKERMLNFAKSYGSVEKPANDTTKYLGMYSNLDVVHVKYGESCMIVLPIVNYSDVDLYNVVISPKESVDPEKWPFEITKTGESQVIPYLPGNKVRETVYDNRMEIGWVWTARSSKLKSGYYALEFDATYERNGATSSTTLTTYVYIDGSPDADVSPTPTPEAQSTPRIVVTGFETDPVKVYAGDTFKLTIHVQNTSKRTAVSNILFALEAQTGSTDGNNSVAGVAPFLPTSGSSNIYVNSIGKGASEDISIEMTARADLGQKPYVLVVNMSYEDENAKAYTAQTNVSIPIYQESRYEVSSPTVDPGFITVGNSANILLNVYNTGKTTLYNVAVKFDQNVVSGGDVYVGKLDPGATGKIDTDVVGLLPNGGNVTAYISYENENGVATTQEVMIPLSIEEEVVIDYPDDYYDTPIEEEPVDGGMPIWVIILISVGGLLVIGAVVLVILLQKRKKAALLNDEDDSDEDEIL